LLYPFLQDCGKLQGFIRQIFADLYGRSILREKYVDLYGGSILREKYVDLYYRFIVREKYCVMILRLIYFDRKNIAKKNRKKREAQHKILNMHREGGLIFDW
jgi:hypothetical protein